MYISLSSSVKFRVSTRFSHFHNPFVVLPKISRVPGSKEGRRRAWPEGLGNTRRNGFARDKHFRRAMPPGLPLFNEVYYSTNFLPIFFLFFFLRNLARSYRLQSLRTEKETERKRTREKSILNRCINIKKKNKLNISYDALSD